MATSSEVQSLIETVAGNNEQMRTLFLAFHDQLATLNASTGNNWLSPTSGVQQPGAMPPPQGTLSVTGANGTYVVAITPAKQAVNATIYQEVSYSPIKSFGEGVVVLPVSATTTFTVPMPGQTLFFRFRSSYNQQDWNSYTLAATTAISSQLQSSAASENNTVLNQSNYAYVDSVAAGGAANVRVYGAAGPYNGWTGVKGTVETPLPSATIVNVALDSNQIVSYDGDQYQAKSTLPGVFPDSWTPVGQVAVVGAGTPTLPVIVLLVQGGFVVGIKSSSTFGNGLTQLPTFTITDGSGTGATMIATGLSGGAITGIQITNAGDGAYSSTPGVTATGGVFSGATGGGTANGGNGGRLTKI